MIQIKKNHRGLLHRDLGIPRGKTIPLSALLRAEHARNPKVRRRAQFAENAREWNH
ncbi:MAG TPA: hypothetical protein VFA33_07500 [Bryobacteraceae bacterium]|nr:hypothetical protein [Bryobacteraceae bacterium]